MNENGPRASRVLGLRVGETVEVRSANEILKTLDDKGCLDSLPFMPEMLEFCGKRFTVYKRADKTCDTIDKTGGRRLLDTVHLREAQQTAGVRCAGTAHGGCEAGCLIFWNESWLKRIEASAKDLGAAPTQSNPAEGMESMLRRSAVVKDGEKDAVRYRCQATQLKAYTRPLAWWDLRQYVRDVASGNVRANELLPALLFVAYRRLVRFGVGYRLLLAVYNWFQARRNGTPWPYFQGELTATPTATLDLKPGEFVRVKSLDQILATLDTRNRNRGMLFAPEMVRFCGGTFRVLKRVNRIIDEKTGAMLTFSNPCIVLENVFCLSEYSEHRVFCPRSIYSYWREIWLERIDNVQ